MDAALTKIVIGTRRKEAEGLRREGEGEGEGVCVCVCVCGCVCVCVCDLGKWSE